MGVSRSPCWSQGSKIEMGLQTQSGWSLSHSLSGKGFTQIPGLDYDETFSPIACFKSLRLLLVLAALEDWKVHQLDVKLVFLNGMLDEEIYMEQPQGFITTGMRHGSATLKRQFMVSNKPPT